MMLGNTLFQRREHNPDARKRTLKSDDVLEVMNNAKCMNSGIYMKCSFIFGTITRCWFFKILFTSDSVCTIDLSQT